MQDLPTWTETTCATVFGEWLRGAGRFAQLGPQYVNPNVIGTADTTSSKRPYTEEEQRDMGRHVADRWPAETRGSRAHWRPFADQVSLPKGFESRVLMGKSTHTALWRVGEHTTMPIKPKSGNMRKSMGLADCHQSGRPPNGRFARRRVIQQYL